MPRGIAGGATWFGGRDELLVTAGQARAQLVVALAGRAAEELQLGDDVTQGAAHDLKAATQLAQRMVTEFGMSVLGPRHVTPAEYQVGPLGEQVHAATQQLLEAAMARARALGAHPAALQRLVAVLLDQETVDLATLRGLVAGTAASTQAPPEIPLADDPPPLNGDGEGPPTGCFDRASAPLAWRPWITDATDHDFVGMVGAAGATVADAASRRLRHRR